MIAARSLLAAAVALAACGDDWPEVVRPGGDTTIEDRTSNAFSFPAPNLTPALLEQHLVGDVGFEAAFVTAPAPVNPGLGPLYNHTSCVGCHVRDGRGLPALGVATSQALVRVSLSDGHGEHPGSPAPVPGLGTQLQDHAVFGVLPEVVLSSSWEQDEGSYGDGEPYLLRRPRLAISLLPGMRPLPPEVLTSLRVAPPMIGRGLLEAIPVATLEALADPEDLDGDGIAGRINLPWDLTRTGPAPGRFGHKCNTASLRQQVAAAYAGDMGVTSSMFPDPNGGAEIDDATVDAVARYSATLAVPARGPASAAAEHGEELFDRWGCSACHTPRLVTGAHEVAALAFQEIWPYSDLLVHDLGDGLSDGRPDFAASGRHWRTAPLWGLGLTQTVSPGVGYLHDGRARTLPEAILWHGGEALRAREAFRAAVKVDRDALIAFLMRL